MFDFVTVNILMIAGYCFAIMSIVAMVILVVMFIFGDYSKKKTPPAEGDLKDSSKKPQLPELCAKKPWYTPLVHRSIDDSRRGGPRSASRPCVAQTSEYNADITRQYYKGYPKLGVLARLKDKVTGKAVISP